MYGYHYGCCSKGVVAVVLFCWEVVFQMLMMLLLFELRMISIISIVIVIQLIKIKKEI